MTGNEALAMWRAFNALADIPAKAEFNYAVARNRKTLRLFVESYAEAEGQRNTGVSAEYRMKRDALIRAHAVLGLDGKPVQDSRGVLLDPNRIDEYHAKLTGFEAKFLDETKALANYESALVALRNDEIGGLGKLVQVKPTDVPDGVTPGVFDALLLMIQET